MIFTQDKLLQRVNSGHYSKFTIVLILIHNIDHYVEMIIFHHLSYNSAFLCLLSDHPWSVFVTLVCLVRYTRPNKCGRIICLIWPMINSNNLYGQLVYSTLICSNNRPTYRESWVDYSMKKYWLNFL